MLSVYATWRPNPKKDYLWTTRYARVEVTDDVGDLGTDGSVQVTLEAGVEGRSEGDVGSGDSLANKEGPLFKLAVDGSQTLYSLVNEVLVDGLVVWDVAGDHAVGDLDSSGDLGDSDKGSWLLVYMNGNGLQMEGKFTS
jgi:hypothetical protein